MGTNGTLSMGKVEELSCLWVGDVQVFQPGLGQQAQEMGGADGNANDDTVVDPQYHPERYDDAPGWTDGSYDEYLYWDVVVLECGCSCRRGKHDCSVDLEFGQNLFL